MYTQLSSSQKKEKKLYLKIFLFYRRCRWHRWTTSIRDYLREFSKKIETISMAYSGARGTLIYEKNLKSKTSCQTPFKYDMELDVESLFWPHVHSWKGKSGNF